MNNKISNADTLSSDMPSVVNLKNKAIRLQCKLNPNCLVISGAPAIWLNTFLITGSIGLMIYAGFTQELFFANEHNSEFVFAITMCAVLAVWYLHVANQLLKIRKIEFFANEKGAFILANRSRHDYFFLPWERVVNHVIPRGYYNGSAAAITLHTTFTEIPHAIIERGSSLGLLDNGFSVFSVIPRCFVRHEFAVDKIEHLRNEFAREHGESPSLPD